MEEILLPIIAIGGMGLIFGGLLAVASKIFAVKEDERIPMITEVLPGANCGGCSFAGCNAYAAAIVEGKAGISCCPVGGEAAAAKIAAIMGVEPEKSEKKVAHVMCSGSTENASTKYINNEELDCFTANRLSGGIKDCGFGCLGFGSCVRKCDFGAISVVNGVAVVDKEKCVNCGACIKECPRGVIKSVPYSATEIVSCSSRASGKIVRAACSVGCIGCGICAKNCESNAIEVKANLASIDYDKCIGCGVCVDKCPRGIIKLIEATPAPEIQVARRARR